MKQVAVRAGVIGRRFIEPGDQFDHAERMNWAVPVDEPAAVKPDKKAKPKAAVPETDPPGEEEVI